MKSLKNRVANKACISNVRNMSLFTLRHIQYLKCYLEQLKLTKIPLYDIIESQSFSTVALLI